jgi:hypothetical protein
MNSGLQASDRVDDEAGCTVLPLARQYNELARRAIEDDEDNADQLADLLERVSHLSPLSSEGAAFLIMSASAELSLLAGGGDAPTVRDASERRAQRLLYRALSALDVPEQLACAREHMMPIDLDPQHTELFA